MKKINLNSKGFMTRADLEHFGGKFSLLERIKLGGVGSTKVIYRSGIPYFDELSDFVENESPFVNFELMKNGLLIMLNRNQKVRLIGYQFSEINRIVLMQRADFQQDVQWQLEIQTVPDNILIFDIPTQQFRTINKFFEKPIFERKLETVFIE